MGLVIDMMIITTVPALHWLLLFCRKADAWAPGLLNAQDEDGTQEHFSVRNECYAGLQSLRFWFHPSSGVCGFGKGLRQKLPNEPVRHLIETTSQVGPKLCRLNWLRK